MLSFKDVSFSYPFQRPLLHRVSFSVASGDITVLWGANGCGKSTLLKMALGQQTPSSGEVCGRPLEPGGIGYAPQDYRRSLLPWRSVADNILLPLYITKASRSESRQRLEEIVATFELETDLHRHARHLSGGEAQRVSLLRALIARPRFLALDEPLSAIDYHSTLKIRERLRAYIRKHAIAALMVSHDLEECLFLADQIVCLEGKPTEVTTLMPIVIPEPRTIESLASPAFIQARGDLIRMLRQPVVQEDRSRRAGSGRSAGNE